MTLTMLVNGQASKVIPADDRGFQYGDGLFETALLIRRRVRFLDRASGTPVRWLRASEYCRAGRTNVAK